jgi:hypothetical protein
MILFEVGINKLKNIENIENLFSKLKKQTNASDREKVITELEVEAEKVFKTKFTIIIDYFSDFSSSAGMVPILKSNKSSFTITKGEDFVKLVSIKKIYLILGINVINKFTAAELVAILLHEIGHVVNHINDKFSLFLKKYLSPVNVVVKTLSKIPIIGLPMFLILILTSRTLHFVDHKSEYNADKFAIQYGYGDELASVMKKFDKMTIKQNKELGFLDKLNLILQKITGSSHPEDSSRIKNILNDILDNYSDKYKTPKLKKAFAEYYSLIK